VVWYPMVLLVPQFFNSFVETYAYFNRAVPYPLLLFCFTGVSLQVFSQDITVTRAFQAIKLQWWISNVNFYESRFPHRSHNKAITDESSTSRKYNDFLFSPPEISSKLLLPNDSFARNKPNTTSALFEKDNSKQDIIIGTQDSNQDIHLVHSNSVQQSSSLSSNCINPSTSSDSSIGSSNQASVPLNSIIDVVESSIHSIGGDEGQIDAMLVNRESTKRISGKFTKSSNSSLDTDLSQEIKTFTIQTLKNL
ncbi:15096_t:CDS:2, partial [Racocetra fulgida]